MGFQKGNKINLGKPCSQETKHKISIANRGKIRSEETRRKISLANKKRIGKKNSFYGKKHTEETRKKLSEIRKRNPVKYWLGKPKETTPNWQGGKSFEPYTTDWTNDLKESIRKRDNFVCYLCGIHQDELDEKLHCHHIDYDKDNLNPKNLISLCRSCHMKTNHNREYWTIYFRNKFLM